MRALFRISAAAAALLVAGSVSAFAACNGDTGTETVLGAASGAAVEGWLLTAVQAPRFGGARGGESATPLASQTTARTVAGRFSITTSSAKTAIGDNRTPMAGAIMISRLINSR